MSASDAAPLPRLGEVFFDVRGHSRTMRLSWYADTDVAVFSIWQGGMCTGTFRLPMADLSRMIEVLQRGPRGRYARGGIDAGAGRGADYEADYKGGYAGDRTVAHNAAEYGAPDHGPGDSGDYGPADYGSGDYGPGDYGPGDYGPGDYGSGDSGSGGYAYEERMSRSGGRRGDRRDRRARRGHGRAGQEQYQGEVTGQRSVPDDEAYGQQRFVPPYVRPQPDPSASGYSDDTEYGLLADPPVASRHSSGRHGGGSSR